MVRRFQFADPRWFRTPLRALLVTTSAFAVLTLYPAFGQGTPDDQHKAIFALVVLLAFVATGCVFSVAMRDGYVLVDDSSLEIRFEAFFNLRVALDNMTRVAPIDPQPRWRYRLGLSTNFRDRIACSHGGQMIEIELSDPVTAKLGTRTVAVRRLWLAVAEDGELLSALEARNDAPACGQTRTA